MLSRLSPVRSIRDPGRAQDGARRRIRERARDWTEAAATILLTVLLVASWATHVIDCATQGFWVRLVAGLLFFPYALLNGLAVLATLWL